MPDDVGIAKKLVDGNATLAYDAFVAWLFRSRPGDRVTYHRGFLWIDRSKARAISHVAKEAMDAYLGGKLNLIQCRHGDFDYEYIAIRR